LSTLRITIHNISGIHTTAINAGEDIVDKAHHEFSDLFEQLGLPSDEASIRQFCAQHRLHEGEKLSEAHFFSDSQQQFIRDALIADSDWVVQIDQLNTALHHVPQTGDGAKIKHANEPTPG